MEDLYLNSIPKGKYIPIWERYLPAIKEALKSGECRSIMVSRQLFESVGKRKKTGYDFTLEYEDLQVTCTLNHLRKHPVKRDLDTVLYCDPDFCTFLMFNDVYIWFHDFILQVQSRATGI